MAKQTAAAAFAAKAMDYSEGDSHDNSCGHGHG